MKFPNRPRWVPKRKPKTVFVFSGGAVRGAAQIGMLKVLSEAGMLPAELMGLNERKFKRLNYLLNNNNFLNSLIKNVYATIN